MGHKVVLKPQLLFYFYAIVLILPHKCNQGWTRTKILHTLVENKPKFGTSSKFAVIFATWLLGFMPMPLPSVEWHEPPCGSCSWPLQCSVMCCHPLVCGCPFGNERASACSYSAPPPMTALVRLFIGTLPPMTLPALDCISWRTLVFTSPNPLTSLLVCCLPWCLAAILTLLQLRLPWHIACMTSPFFLLLYYCVWTSAVAAGDCIEGIDLGVHCSVHQILV